MYFINESVLFQVPVLMASATLRLSAMIRTLQNVKEKR